MPQSVVIEHIVIVEFNRDSEIPTSAPPLSNQVRLPLALEPHRKRINVKPSSRSATDHTSVESNFADILNPC